MYVTMQTPNQVTVCRQSAELNKLRQDCGRLVSELNEKTGKLQQEGVQKKSAEQAAAQLKVTARLLPPVVHATMPASVT